MKLPLCLALAGCLALPARADLSYTQTTTSTFGGRMPPGGGMKSKTWIKGGKMRIESDLMGSRNIMLITSPGGPATQIDPVSKTYFMWRTNFVGGPSKVSASVKNLGVETVRGIKAPHWRVDLRVNVKTKSGARALNVATEIWSSSTPYPAVQGGSLTKLPPNIAGFLGNNAKITGDTKGLSSAFKNVPLRIKTFMNGNAMNTIETSNISTKNVPASLFVIPAGYRKTSQAEWLKMQHQTMMKRMQGMKGMPRRAR